MEGRSIGKRRMGRERERVAEAVHGTQANRTGHILDRMNPPPKVGTAFPGMQRVTMITF